MNTSILIHVPKLRALFFCNISLTTRQHQSCSSATYRLFRSQQMPLLLIAFLASLLTAGLKAETTASAKLTTSTASTRQPLIAPPKRDVPGFRQPLTTGDLYVPDYYKNDLTTGTDVLVFFHGAKWVAEQNLYDSRKNAILISLTQGTADYRTSMSTPGLFDRILSEALTAGADAGITSQPLGRLALASFSGGWPAVDVILSNQTWRSRVTDVVLADSLYPARISGKESPINPDTMRGVVGFAEAAAAGKANFLFTHLFPPKVEHRGNTTTLAATWLIQHVSARPGDEAFVTSGGVKALYRADLRGFHVFGIPGMTTQDHFDHYYHIVDLFRLLSFPAVDSK